MLLLIAGITLPAFSIADGESENKGASPSLEVSVSDVVYLNGSGVLDFGSSDQNGTPFFQTITLRNNGLTDLIISDAGIIFQDNFDSDSSSNYTLSSFENDVFDAFFGVDTSEFVLSDESTLITESPNYNPGADIANRALQTFVNNQPTVEANPTSLAIFPNIPDITGDHQVTVDVIYRVARGGGSSESLMIGLLATENSVPNLFSNEIGEDTGYYGSIFPDYDTSSRDIAFKKGNDDDLGQSPLDGNFGWGLSGPQPSNILLTNPDGPWMAETNNPDSNGASGEFNFGDALFETRQSSNGPYDPLQFSASEGAPLEEWFTLRMSYIDGVAIFSAKPVNEPDFEIICTYDDENDTFLNGRPFVAHEDIFQSTNDKNFVLFDNLIVERLDSAAFEVTPPFGLTETLRGPIPPGEERTITVQLPTSTPGIFNGEISFETNDPDNPAFSLNLSGTVIEDIILTPPTVQIDVPFSFMSVLNLDETVFDFMGTAMDNNYPIACVEWRNFMEETEFDTGWLPATDISPGEDFTEWQFTPLLGKQPDNNLIRVRATNSEGISSMEVERTIITTPSLIDLLVLTEFTDIWGSINRTGTFMTPEQYLFLSFRHEYQDNWQALVLDYNGDGFDDILTVTEFDDYWYSLNNGDGSFTGPVRGTGGYRAGIPLPGSAMTEQVFSGDINLDGYDDLIQYTNPDHIFFGINDRQGNIPPPTFAGGLTNVGDYVTAGDFTGDGIIDILSVNSDARGEIIVYEIVSDNNFVGKSLGTTDFQFDPENGHGIHTGDFNGDGVTDLLQITPSTDAFVVLMNSDLDKPVSPPERWAVLGFRSDTSLGNGWWVFTGDVDANGLDDLIQLNEFGEIWISKSTGSAFTTPELNASLGFQHKPEGPWQTFVGNFMNGANR